MISITKKEEKLHDAGCKNSYFTSADVFMLGYGRGVSRYPHFYAKYLDMYQVLPHPYLWSINGFPVDQLIKKNGYYTWQVKQIFFYGNVLNLG